MPDATFPMTVTSPAAVTDGSASRTAAGGACGRGAARLWSGNQMVVEATLRAGCLYTGIEQPDAVLITSADGLREVRGRGDLAALAGGGIVIADESVAAEVPGDRTLSLPLRRTLSPRLAALGAVAALVERAGILECEALEAAAA